MALLFLNRSRAHRNLKTAVSVAALLYALLFSSCAQLPEYAQPRFHTSPDALSTVTSGFRYRELTVEDFKAESLPADYQQYHDSINARSCLSIRPTNSTNAQISKVPYYGNTLYVGNFNHISFEALFVPSCSWWNPNVAGSKRAYVLQHEQIHFAISELTARRVTNELAAKMKDYTAIGGTDVEVRDDLMKVLMDSVHEIVGSELEIHTDFDEDTSLFFDEEKQEDWLAEMENRLKPSDISP